MEIILLLVLILSVGFLLLDPANHGIRFNSWFLGMKTATHEFFLLTFRLQIFRALVGIIDDYFEGYFSQEMTESQVIIYYHILLLEILPAYPYRKTFLRLRLILG